VPRRVQAFQFYRAADLDQVAGLQAAVDTADLAAAAVVRQQLRASGGNDGVVAAGVVMVLAPA
jgi:hypothetical protein